MCTFNHVWIWLIIIKTPLWCKVFTLISLNCNNEPHDALSWWRNKKKKLSLIATEKKNSWQQAIKHWCSVMRLLFIFGARRQTAMITHTLKHYLRNNHDTQYGVNNMEIIIRQHLIFNWHVMIGKFVYLMGEKKDF